MCYKCYERYLISRGILVISGIAIINDYIDYDNALLVNYSLN